VYHKIDSYLCVVLIFNVTTFENFSGVWDNINGHSSKHIEVFIAWFISTVLFVLTSPPLPYRCSKKGVFSPFSLRVSFRLAQFHAIKIIHEPDKVLHKPASCLGLGNCTLRSDRFWQTRSGRCPVHSELTLKVFLYSLGAYRILNISWPVKYRNIGLITLWYII